MSGIEILKLFIAENKKREQNLIPKGYKKLEVSKVDDKEFYLHCQLPSLQIDNLLKN